MRLFLLRYSYCEGSGQPSLTLAREKEDGNAVTRERRDIEWLVNWALEAQGLALVVVDGGTNSLNWTELGTRIDCGAPSGGSGLGRGVIDGAPDFDAVVIAEAITGLPQEAAALVVRFGRLGVGDFARPDWCEEGVGKWEVVRTSTGKVKWDWEDPVKRRGERVPKQEFVGHSPQHIEFWRAQYSLWWTGLAELVPIVNLAMKGHEALPPVAKARPWETAGVVHVDESAPVPVPARASVPEPRRRRGRAAVGA